MRLTYRGQSYTASSQAETASFSHTYRGTPYSHSPSQAAPLTASLTYRGITTGNSSSQVSGQPALV